MPGWKTAQSKRKIDKNSKLAFLVLAILVLFLVFSQIFRFTKILLSPWQNSKLQKSYSWDGQFNINLLFRAKGVSLISYNPTDQKIVIVDIPDETYLEASGGFGSWQLRSLFDLGGDKLLKDTLTQFLGQPIDGFLDFQESYKSKTPSEIVDLVRNSLTGGVNILSNLKTDLTLWELIRLKLGLNMVRFDKLTQIDLQKKGALSKEKLLDGTEILIADPNILDTVLVDLSDPKIKNEHKTISIFNATQKPLFAQRWARLITNIGGDVIITSNAQSKSDKTIVVGEKGDTLKRLQQIFNFHCKKEDCDKIQKIDLDIVSSRGQINIKLSPDLTN